MNSGVKMVLLFLLLLGVGIGGGVLIGKVGMKQQPAGPSTSIQVENNQPPQAPTVTPADVNAPIDHPELAGKGEGISTDIVDTAFGTKNVQVTLYPNETQTDVIVTSYFNPPKAGTFYAAWLTSKQNVPPLLVGKMEMDNGVYRVEAIFDKSIIKDFDTLQLTAETTDDNQPETIITTTKLNQ